MASVNRPNLLFYSKANNECIELLRIMKQYQIDKEFKIINVDNNKSEVIKKIKVIPTMIIPSINKVIIGESVNEFVISVINSRINKQQIINKTQPNQITDEQHNKLIDKPILDKSTVNITNEDIKENLNNELNDNKTNNRTNPILGYIEDEMGGLSDKYSYLNINISPMHNYGYYQ